MGVTGDRWERWQVRASSVGLALKLLFGGISEGTNIRISIPFGLNPLPFLLPINITCDVKLGSNILIYFRYYGYGTTRLQEYPDSNLVGWRGYQKNSLRNATRAGKLVWQKLLLGGMLRIVARQTHESPAPTPPRKSRGNRVFNLPRDCTLGRDCHVLEDHVRCAEAPPREDVGAPERRCQTCLRGGRASLRGHVTSIGSRGNEKRGVRARLGEQGKRSPIRRKISESSSEILAWAVRLHPIHLNGLEARNRV